MSSSTVMSTRDFLVSVIDGRVDDDVQTKAKALLDGLDARNAKRKSADSKAKRETASRRTVVLATLSDDCPLLADDIASATGLSVGQVRSALSALVRDGLADKAEIKVGKSRRVVYVTHSEVSA